jgi:type I restriction enzyme S subunit
MARSNLPENWRLLPFSEFLEPAKRKFKLEDDVEYRICGVRWYGKGAFIRETTRGRDVKIKSKNIIRAGDVVYSKLFAWRGSFAVIESELDGCCVSDEFPVYRLNELLVLPRYLHWYFLTERVRNDAERMSRGVSAASRFRLHERDFSKLELPTPPLAEQQRIVARIDALAARIAEAQKLQAEATEEAEGLRDSNSAEIFEDLTKRFPLGLRMPI